MGATRSRRAHDAGEREVQTKNTRPTKVEKQAKLRHVGQMERTECAAILPKGGRGGRNACPKIRLEERPSTHQRELRPTRDEGIRDGGMTLARVALGLCPMTRLILTYFDSPTSRGEECRLALHLAGVDFEDRRIQRKDWTTLKPTTPFGSLPTLELPGKPVVGQSNAILGHIGRHHGLLPKDEWEALRLESLMCAVEDLRHAITKTFGIQDPDELKLKRRELVEGPIQTWATNTERQIIGPFAGGERISVADIKLFVVGGWLKKGVLDHVPSDVISPFPKLEQLYHAVASHPKIVEWYARSR